MTATPPGPDTPADNDPRRLSGLDRLRLIRDGELPPPPISRVLALRLAEVDHGRAVFTGDPRPDFYNPMRRIHGGWTATLLDSCMSCAVLTMLPPGADNSTVEFKTELLRPITADTGPVTAEGRAVKVGNRIGFAEGVITDANGEVLAKGTATCAVRRR